MEKLESSKDLRQKIVEATHDLKDEAENYEKIRKEADRVYDALMNIWREILFLGISLFVIGVVIGFMLGVSV